MNIQCLTFFIIFFITSEMMMSVMTIINILTLRRAKMYAGHIKPLRINQCSPLVSHFEYMPTLMH